MFAKLFIFECRYHLRQPSFLVISLVLLLLPFLAITTENIQIGSTNHLNLNSPFGLASVSLIMSLFAIFMVVNFVADTALRDQQSAMLEMIHSKPVSPCLYRIAGFIAAYFMCILAFAMVPLGSFLGSVMPWLDDARIGQNRVVFYAYPYFVFALTTLFLLASSVYAISQKVKSIFTLYLLALTIFIVYVVLKNSFEQSEFSDYLNESATTEIYTLTDATQAWSAFEKNNLSLPINTEIVTNRFLWLGIGTVILFSFGGFFRPLVLHTGKDKHHLEPQSLIPRQASSFTSLSRQQHSYFFQRLLHCTWFEMKHILTNPAFLILLLFSLFNMLMQFVYSANDYDAANLPLTQNMVDTIEQSFGLMLIIVITFYSAECLWRDKRLKIHEIIDSTATSNGLFYLSKLLAVHAVIAVTLCLAIVLAIVNQLSHQYINISLSQYFLSVFYFQAPNYSLYVFLAFAIQVLSPNKYLGMLGFVGCLLFFVLLKQLGFEHNMFFYASWPTMPYSDMNGFAGYLNSHAWYLAYWYSLALVLACLSYGLWRRAYAGQMAYRFASVPTNLDRVGQLLMGAALLSFVLLGAFIRYQTSVANQYISPQTALDISQEYEYVYAKYSALAVPTVTKIHADIAIFPEQRRIESIAQIWLENNTSEPIERFLVNLPDHSPQVSVLITEGQLEEVNYRLNTAWMNFERPLAVGERRQATIKIVREHHGFKDSNEDVMLVQNGTFIDSDALFPSFGVRPERFIQTPLLRQKRGMEPFEFDPQAYTGHLNLINFSAIISTSSEQTVLTSGSLQAEWQQGGRNYFHYVTPRAIPNHFVIASARLAQKQFIHQQTRLSVHYHPEHAWNVTRMSEAMQDALTYYSNAFAPYPYQQLRIVEFPSYRDLAHSSPNIIGFPESINFTADISNTQNKEVDAVYMRTAHEVAHQWFGQWLIPARAPGAAVLTDTLSQYATLSLIEQKYGRSALQGILQYELAQYQSGRASDYQVELPLMHADIEQAYIHTHKGALVMLAIRDRIGSDAVHQAIRSLLVRYGKQPLVAKSEDLVLALKDAASEQHHSFIERQFTQLGLVDLKLEQATWKVD